MTLSLFLVAAGCFLFVTACTVPAQAQVISKNLGVMVYPSKGQTGDAQGTDETQCYTWAQKQTGKTHPSSPPPTQQKTGPDGSRVKGAARGAARGAVVGEIANDDAGKGGAVGAAAGAVRGKRESRKAEAQEQQNAAAAQKQTFNKAFCACMEGRGYSVK
jgi:hypothetical protein